MLALAALTGRQTDRVGSGKAIWRGRKPRSRCARACACVRALLMCRVPWCTRAEQASLNLEVGARPSIVFGSITKPLAMYEV